MLNFYGLIHLKLDAFLLPGVAGAHPGVQGVGSRHRIGRQFEVHLMAPGAVEPAVIHALGLSQRFSLEEDLSGDGYGQGDLLRGKDGVSGYQFQGLSLAAPGRQDLDLVQLQDAAAGGAGALPGDDVLPVQA